MYGPAGKSNCGAVAGVLFGGMTLMGLAIIGLGTVIQWVFG